MPKTAKIAKTQRVPNPKIVVRGRIAMQYSSSRKRGETEEMKYDEDVNGSLTRVNEPMPSVGVKIEPGSTDDGHGVRGVWERNGEEVEGNHLEYGYGYDGSGEKFEGDRGDAASLGVYAYDGYRGGEMFAGYQNGTEMNWGSLLEHGNDPYGNGYGNEFGEVVDTSQFRLPVDMEHGNRGMEGGFGEAWSLNPPAATFQLDFVDQSMGLRGDSTVNRNAEVLNDFSHQGIDTSFADAARRAIGVNFPEPDEVIQSIEFDEYVDSGTEDWELSTSEEDDFDSGSCDDDDGGSDNGSAGLTEPEETHHEEVAQQSIVKFVAPIAPMMTKTASSSPEPLPTPKVMHQRIRSVKLDDVTNFACEVFEIEDVEDLRICVRDKPERGDVLFGDLVSEYTYKAFGQQSDGTPINLSLVETAELMKLQNLVALKQKKIWELEAKLRER